MVHIKRLELSRFKSFGSTTQVPLLPGFTAISGPNGSGKSNILDALLFALGLASSRGMRAERLPDLVNHDKGNGSSRRAETSVTVWFDLSDADDLDGIAVVAVDGSDRLSANGSRSEDNASPSNGSSGSERAAAPVRKSLEWSVTRRLRVTKEGNYSSTYYINGEVCTQTELHEQLQRLRIYPEGYNVVLQGDVTRIITMNAKDRREIIDELAGVAEFDRRIDRAKENLESVREREERCQIVEQELTRARDRADSERRKAEKYRDLKRHVELQQQQAAVLEWRSLQQQETHLQQQIAAGDAQIERATTQLRALAEQIATGTERRDRLNARVKSLGEDEQLAVTSELAKLEAQLQQLQQRGSDLAQTATETAASERTTQAEIEQIAQNLQRLHEERATLEQTRVALAAERDRAAATLQASKARADEIASASETWVQQQAALSRQVGALQTELDPQRTERTRLQERTAQLDDKLAAGAEILAQVAPELTEKRAALEHLTAAAAATEKHIGDLAETLAAAEGDRRLQQDTQNRLQREQRDKQRQLDKLEASLQAQQEAQGTYATQAILQADLPGVCGLVAQLGEVEARYQLALETAAGGRLACIVVEDDGVAAAGIELLKRERAGRATFLPLNKIRAPHLSPVRAVESARGFIDYAVHLVACDPRYEVIFEYVFGNTVVFATLNDARPHLGRARIVTLDGELLESSGALSGGSRSRRSSLHFGAGNADESRELAALKDRLQEIERILRACDATLQHANEQCEQLASDLGSARQTRQQQTWQLQQLGRDIERLRTQHDQTAAHQERDRAERSELSARLETFERDLPPRETELDRLRRDLAELERAHSHSEWQTMQAQIRSQETRLQERERALHSADEQIRARTTESERACEKRQTARDRLASLQQQQSELRTQQTALSEQQTVLQAQVNETQAALKQLSHSLWEAKQERDAAEAQLEELQKQQRQTAWDRDKCRETIDAHHLALAGLSERRRACEAELPEPLPELPVVCNTEGEAIADDNYRDRLAALQEQIRSSGKRLQAMEPVNMLAIREYEQARARLDDLSAKRAAIEAERTELLLRIETFTTRREHAFKEAFDAVNLNFQSIFAELSDGDGYLQLDTPDDIANSGLALVAHPKGKPVRRLHSMSGGEKSLTALSFIFALQRYRPSPFYAFDEVDMFLDGANVERLAKMMRRQAQQAQFIVVSLRRPTIESANRTIGVTQARGAYTQVLGLKL